MIYESLYFRMLSVNKFNDGSFILGSFHEYGLVICIVTLVVLISVAVTAISD